MVGTPMNTVTRSALPSFPSRRRCQRPDGLRGLKWGGETINVSGRLQVVGRLAMRE